jgi:hypothetical protein
MGDRPTACRNDAVTVSGEYTGRTRVNRQCDNGPRFAFRLCIDDILPQIETPL